MNRNTMRAYRRAQRTCARCRNHSLNILVRGHKRYCKYRHCICDKCVQTAQRQKLMAVQTAQRRADEEDRRRSKAETESLSSSVSVKGLYRPYEISTNKDKHHLRPPTMNDASQNKETNKQLLDSVSLLQGMCNLPASAAPLLHVILTSVSPNPITVYRLFIKAKRMLREQRLKEGDATISPLPDDTPASTSASAALSERVQQHLSIHCDACLSASLFQACYPYPKYVITSTINENSDIS